MDLEERLNQIRGVGEEIITEEELQQLLETKDHPVAYDGFEPSGIAHLPVGVYRPLLLKDMIDTGVHFKILLADSFAWINNKFGGDLEKIREAGRYFIEVWEAAGVDMNKIELVWHKDLFDDPEYWKKVVLIAKNHTLTRTIRSLAIAGRSDTDANPAAFALYPSMQCTDIFHLNVDICQLGLDQRKVNMLAREIVEKKGLKEALDYGNSKAGKPVMVSHRMLLGLTGPVEESQGLDEDPSVDREISSKMSKSLPDTAIFVHDSRKDIHRKINKAYCPAKTVEDNPIMEYVKEIIFRGFDEFEIKRAKKFGGDITYHSFQELERDFRTGELHPMDLKEATADYLDRLIEPIRKHFEKDRRARELYENVCGFEVTR